MKNRRTADRQVDLFTETDPQDVQDDLPLEIRGQQEERQQQEQRFTAIQVLLGPYFLPALAALAEGHLVEQVIECLKKSIPGIMEPQGATNLWDEICVGLREDSPFTDLYTEHIFKIIKQEAKKLPQTERVALWLTTYWGEIFLGDLPEEVKVPEGIPVCDDEIAKHFVQSVLYEAWNYESS